MVQCKFNIIMTIQRLRMMCSVVVLVWLMSWTPYLIVFLLPQLGLGHLLTPDVSPNKK